MSAPPSPYRQVLGAAFDRLPAPIRDLHDRAAVADGVADVERGGGRLVGLVADLFGFPKAGRDVPVRVAFDRTPARDLWTRRFDAGAPLRSRQVARVRAGRPVLAECLGPFRFDCALEPDGDGLCLRPVGWAALGLPLPLAFAPRADARESVRDGRYAFDVAVRLPGLGLLVRYRGVLRPTVLRDA